VRGAVLDHDDPVRGEWDLAVVGPHFAGALVARDLGDDGPDLDRRFEFVLTYERELVVDVASALLARIAPA
jgi:DICT domain-containing protein